MSKSNPTRRPFRPSLLPLEDRLTPAYTFGATTFAATNLELGQPGVTVLDMRTGANPNDEATANLSLGANAFRFYGDVATGADALTVSVNGNISLGGPLESAGPTDFVNTSLTGLEEGTGRGTIAPLWDDWLATSSEPAVVLYQVVGNQLVIEWQKLKHASLTGTQASEVSFQAVLELNTGNRPGDITFNYLDTDADTTDAMGVDSGGSATIGVRAAGFDDATDPNPGAQRTLVSFDEATTMAAGGAAVALVWANTAPAVTAFEATPEAINEGGQVSVSGAFDDADTTDTHAVTVSWGDGTPDTVVTLPAGFTDFAGLTHTYADNPAAAPNGSFTVTVTVADLLSTSAAASADVQVSNVPLVLTVGGASAIDEAGTLARTITFTDRAGDGPHTATVDWGDGTPAVALGTVASPFVVSRAYPLSGAYTVTLTVADKDGAAVSESFDLTVANVAPVVTAAAAQTGIEGIGAAVALGSFTDPGAAGDGPYIVVVAWGDGSPDTTFTVAAPGALPAQAHAFPNDGGYTVQVTVTDADGAAGSGTFAVAASDVPPAMTPPADRTVSEGALNFFGFGSFADVPADAPFTLTVDWGDGSDPLVAPGGTFDGIHTYVNDGSFTLTVTVTDASGVSSFSTSTVVVSNGDPVAAILGTPATAPEGTPITLGSYAADPGPLDVLTRAWFVTKDGTPFAAAGDTADFTFTPDDAGEYVVTLTVTDGDGGEVTATATVTAENAPPVVAIVGAPATVVEGSPVLVDAVASDPGNDALTYAWTVTRGGAVLSAGSGTGHAFTPDDEGEYVVTVTVSDGAGGEATAAVTIDVTNADPTTAITGAPAPSPEGTPITLGSTASDPGTADVLTRAWTVTKNGTAFGSGGDTAGFSFTPDDDGSYIVTLTVTDGDGGTATDAATITVENVAPTAAITGTPATSVEGEAVTVGGSATDPGADTLSYNWTVTRGGTVVATGTGTGLTFTPDDEGTYVVALTATDGDADTVATTLSVTNADPTAAITGAPATSPEGTPITVGSTISDPGTADVLTRAWLVTKNGGVFAGGSGPTITFTPDDEGSYVVTLTVTDGDGGTATDAATITVENVAPTAAITGATATSVEGAVVALGSTATDPGSDTLSRSWGVTKNGQPFGAGGSGTAFAFTPDDEGAYVVTLTVTDGDGGTITATATVAVTNANPTVTSDTAAVGGPEGSPITNTGRFGDAGADDVTLTASVGVVVQQSNGSWSWSFTPADDDAPGVSSGVTITATDGDGGTAATTFALAVSNVAPVLTVASDQVAGEGTRLEVAGLGRFTDVGTGASETFTATINWGDGTAADTVPVTGAFGGAHTYADDGTYTVTVTLADDDGGADVKTFRVVVANAAPSVRLVAPDSATGGVPVTLTAVGSDVGADPLAFAWTVTDDRGAVVATGAGAAFTFTPTRGGVHTVEVVVSDGDGGTAAATTTLAVRVADVTATGATGANGSLVRVVKADGTTTDLVAFDSRFTGEVRPATGDVDGDGIADVVVVAGPGGGPRVRVFSGADMSVIRDFFAYEESFRGGLFVAVADVDGDGRTDIVTGPDVGGGPVVKVFGGADGRLIFSELAFEETFRGGVRVAAGDLDGDGRAEVVAGAGTGGSPRVVAFDPRTGGRVADFLAGDPAGTAGVRVSARDADADGTAEIATTVPGVRGGRFWDVTAAGVTEDTGVLFDGVFIDAPV